MGSDEKAIQATDDAGAAIEALVMLGDISKLQPRDRASYYVQLCGSLGLNHLTQPIKFIAFQGKTIPYATRDATDQLARRHGVNREIVEGPEVRDYGGAKLLYALCRATLPNGRVETSTSLVPVPSGGGEALANAVMKCETKSKRRATLSIVGLGILDESELDTMPGARRLSHVEVMDGVDPTTLRTIAARAEMHDRDDVEVAEPDPLVAVRDALAQIDGPPSIGQAAAIYCDERAGLSQEDAGAAHELLYLATIAGFPVGTPKKEMERAGFSKAALNRAIVAEKARRDGPPEPPPGGGAPKPAGDSAEDVLDGEIAAASAGDERALALAWWTRHVAEKRDKFDLAHSFLKYERDLVARGVRDACLAITAAALKPMLGTDSEMQAVNFVVAQSARRRAA